MRPVLAVIAGVVLAGVIVLAVEWLGHALFAVPEMSSDPAVMRSQLSAYLATAPVAALAFPLLAMVAGAFSGGLLAARIAPAKGRVVGAIVGLIEMCLGLINVVMIPHPIWFSILTVMLVAPAGWIGGDLGSRGRQKTAETAV